MPGPLPDLFDSLEDEPKPGSPYARSTLDRLSFTLKLRERGYRNTALLRAFELAPRESFAPRRYADLARRDMALPLACGQTMTAPLALARLISLASIEPTHRVLEIGTGSGYATAILGHLAGEVVSIERYQSLAIEAEGKLKDFGQGQGKISVQHGDGLDRIARGVFDRIIVDAALTEWPETLVTALSPGGRIVAAIGQGQAAHLSLLEMTPAGERRESAHESYDATPLARGRASAL